MGKPAIAKWKSVINNTLDRLWDCIYFEPHKERLIIGLSYKAEREDSNLRAQKRICFDFVLACPTGPINDEKSFAEAKMQLFRFFNYVLRCGRDSQIIFWWKIANRQGH